MIRYSPVIMPDKYWTHIRSYINPLVTIAPQLVFFDNNNPQTSAYLKFLSLKAIPFKDDIPNSQNRWILSAEHIQSLKGIQPRIIMQHALHTSFSKEAVKNAITGYSQKTYEKLVEKGKATTIDTACKFEKWTKDESGKWLPPESNGTLIIPYFTPTKNHTEEEFKRNQEDLGVPNFTVRTNSRTMKYARMATETYNEVEDKKVLRRAPYILFPNLTPKTKAISENMLIDDLAEERAESKNLAFADARADIAASLDILKARMESNKKPPIYIIEGEKKALALQAAFEAQCENALLDIAKNESFEIPARGEVVGISGVWQTQSKTTDLHEDLTKSIDFTGRDVVIVFDNDIETNINVAFALACFGAGIKKAGANSVSTVLPHVNYACENQKEKCKGFDDAVVTLAQVYALDYGSINITKQNLRDAQATSINFQVNHQESMLSLPYQFQPGILFAYFDNQRTYPQALEFPQF